MRPLLVVECSCVVDVSCSLCSFYRDIKDTTVGTLSQRITNQLMGLKGLSQQLNEIHTYLDKVASGQLPVNHQIIYLLQVTQHIMYTSFSYNFAHMLHPAIGDRLPACVTQFTEYF